MVVPVGLLLRWARTQPVGCQSQMFGELVSQVPDVGHPPFSPQGEALGLRCPRDYGLWNCVSASPNHLSVAFLLFADAKHLLRWCPGFCGVFLVVVVFFF